MTTEMPAVLMHRGACSREEPQPKFQPPTITSPGCTRCTKFLSMSSMQWAASSWAFWVFRYRAGMITSVSTLSLIHIYKGGRKVHFLAKRRMEAELPIEKVGAELRGMMSWLKK